MMRRLITFGIAIAFLGTVVSCSSSTGSDGGGGGGGDTTPTFDLTTSANPTEGGSVDPSSGTFDEGDQVTVEAVPNTGWEFVDWTGDIQSSDNPLTFTIDSDTDLTANFNATSSIYSVDLTVEDSLNSAMLKFGQDEDGTANSNDVATDGSPLDRESPPAPQAPSLWTYFKADGDTLLLHSFREIDAQSILWNVQYPQVQGDSLTFTWSITQTRIAGSLILRNGDSSIEVDMLTEQMLEINVNNTDSLLIEYTLGN